MTIQTLQRKTTAHGRHDVLIGLLLIMVTLAVYAQVGQFEFVGYDDDVYIKDNPHVRSGLTLKGLVWSLTDTHGDNWHPVTWLSHMLDVALFGLNPGLHHLTSLLLHIANTLLLFLTFKKMTGDSGRSGFVAALFALHPLQVESVAWVAERKNVLSTFFWILTMFSYARYVARPGISRYLLVVVVFICGLMSKPMLVTLPLVLLLLDVWPLGRWQIEMLESDAAAPRKKAAAIHLILEKVPMVLLAAAAGIMTLRAERVYTFDLIPLHARIANALISYLAYIQKMVWPVKLACFYPYPNFFPSWKVAAAGIVLAVISVAALKNFRQRPYLIVGWLWYLVTLMPVIGLLQVGAQAMADRYAYITLVGWYIIIAWGLPLSFETQDRKKMGITVSALVLLTILAVFSWNQARYWKDRLTLFEHAVAVTENNYLAHNNLGYALAANGRTAAAVKQYQEALRIRPDYAEARSNLGLALERQGHIKEAADLYREALRAQPNFAAAHNNLGAVLAGQGLVDDAVGHYREALRIQPDFAEVHNNLGAILIETGRMDEAVMHYREALRIQPDLAVAHINLGKALAAQGRPAEAIEHYVKALQIEPDLAEAHFNLAIALDKQDRINDAVVHYMEVLKVQPDNVPTHIYLGAVLAKQGRLEDAAGHYLQALRIQPDALDAHYNLGNVRARQGRLDEAITQYQEALRLRPDDAAVHNNWGIALVQKGDVDGAIEHFQEALKIKPGDVAAENNLQKAISSRKHREN